MLNVFIVKIRIASISTTTNYEESFSKQQVVFYSFFKLNFLCAPGARKVPLRHWKLTAAFRVPLLHFVPYSTCDAHEIFNSLNIVNLTVLTDNAALWKPKLVRWMVSATSCFMSRFSMSNSSPFTPWREPCDKNIQVAYKLGFSSLGYEPFNVYSCLFASFGCASETRSLKKIFLCFDYSHRAIAQKTLLYSTTDAYTKAKIWSLKWEKKRNNLTDEHLQDGPYVNGQRFFPLPVRYHHAQRS